MSEWVRPALCTSQSTLQSLKSAPWHCITRPSRRLKVAVIYSTRDEKCGCGTGAIATLHMTSGVGVSETVRVVVREAVWLVVLVAVAVDVDVGVGVRVLGLSLGMGVRVAITVRVLVAVAVAVVVWVGRCVALGVGVLVGAGVMVLVALGVEVHERVIWGVGVVVRVGAPAPQRKAAGDRGWRLGFWKSPNPQLAKAGRVSICLTDTDRYSPTKGPAFDQPSKRGGHPTACEKFGGWWGGMGWGGGPIFCHVFHVQLISP